MIMEIDASELKIGDEILIPVKVFNVRRESGTVVVYLEKPDAIRHAYQQEKVVYPADKVLTIKTPRR